MTEEIKSQIKAILDGILHKCPAPLGVYLHGSACLGGFVDRCSDIDILIITGQGMTKAERADFADALLPLHNRPRPIELSVVTDDDIRNLPVLCEFHFSSLWADRYAAHDENNRLLTGKFEDGDIPAYIKLIRQCGIILYGAPPETLLPDISDELFYRSVSDGIEHFSFEDYGLFDSNILTLARIDSFSYTREILTKVRGAVWAIGKFPQYSNLLTEAIDAYTGKKVPHYDGDELAKYREFMISDILRGLK